MISRLQTLLGDILEMPASAHTFLFQYLKLAVTTFPELQQKKTLQYNSNIHLNQDFLYKHFSFQIVSTL